MLRGALFLMGLGVLSLPFACGGEFTSGETASSAQGGASSSSTNSGAGDQGGFGTGGSPPQGQCPDGTYQVPEVPEGWQGPVMIAVYVPDTTGPPCLNMDPGFDFLDGFRVDPSNCECSCTPPLQSDCEAVVELYGNDSSCTTMNGNITVFANFCQLLNAGPNTVSWTPGPPGGGSCQATPTSEHPAPTWDDGVKVCPLETTRVENVDCARPEDSFLNRLCIVQVGSAECPPDYPERNKVYQGYVDNRDCSACTCDTQNAVCAGKVDFFLDQSCSAMDPGELLPNECEQHVADYARYTPALQPNASCPPSNPMPTGQAVQTGEFTTCCTN